MSRRAVFHCGAPDLRPGRAAKTARSLFGFGVGRRNWILVIHHLRFISIFGHEKSPQQWSGKILASYPSDFEFWLDAGAPGIAEVDLQAYLANYPL